jgi:hypothetical protein
VKNLNLIHTVHSQMCQVSPASEFILTNYSSIARIFQDNVAEMKTYALCVGSICREKPQSLPPVSELDEENQITVYSHIILVGSHIISAFCLQPSRY